MLYEALVWPLKSTPSDRHTSCAESKASQPGIPDLTHPCINNDGIYVSASAQVSVPRTLHVLLEHNTMQVLSLGPSPPVCICNDRIDHEFSSHMGDSVVQKWLDLHVLTQWIDSIQVFMSWALQAILGSSQIGGRLYLPHFFQGDHVGAAARLDLPEHAVQVQLLVRKDGHLELAAVEAVPVADQHHKALLAQRLQHLQHLLYIITQQSVTGSKAFEGGTDTSSVQNLQMLSGHAAGKSCMFMAKATIPVCMVPWQVSVNVYEIQCKQCRWGFQAHV